jgi:FtsP/CotA-like multicopper oxidase with cupredoxin domain
MGGLVIGLTVLPDAGAAPAPVAAKPARTLQLVISENPEKIPLYRLEVKDPEVSTKSGDEKTPSLLGPPIVLRRGEVVEIEVKNESPNPTAIHWHGIEVESYYDGVPGWTGSAQKVSPAIAPGTSFVARMAPPRAGTFIYHTHWHDRAQLLNGMYGPLIVVEPGQPYDPERDKIFVVSTGDYAPFGEMILINGAPEPVPVALKTGIRYRLRLINITANDPDVRVKLVSQVVPVEGTVVARDGADVPAALRTLAKIDLALPVGSTLDVEYQPDREGYVEMQVPAPGFQALVMQPLVVVAPK